MLASLAQAELAALGAALGRGHIAANRAYEDTGHADPGLAWVRGECFDVLAQDVLPLVRTGR